MKQLFSILLLAVFFFSCQKSKEVAADETQAPEDFDSYRKTFFSNLNSPEDIAAKLQATGADFNPTLLNDPKNAPNYTTEQAKVAANLGVYLADLNYSVAYKQSSNTKELFTAAHELSKALGMEQTTLDFLMKRYTENLAQNDSAHAVINDLFKSSTTDFEGTPHEKMVGIAMSAYQIENLHLALGIIQNYPKDMLPEDARMVILIPIFKIVLTQRENIQMISDYLKTVSDPDMSTNYEYYSGAFKELLGLYDKLDVDQKIAENKGTELMNDQVIQELVIKVSAIRNKIISY